MLSPDDNELTGPQEAGKRILSSRMCALPVKFLFDGADGAGKGGRLRIVVPSSTIKDGSGGRTKSAVVVKIDI
jgi:hypothetical protein